MAANKTSKSNEGYFAKYKSTNKEASNRKLKLERQLKLQPGNEAQILLAIKNIHHRRKTPVTPVWTHQMIALASMMKSFTGKFDKQAFSPDDKVSAPALKVRVESKFVRSGKKGVLVSRLPANPKESMFSLGARARVTG